MLIVLCMDLMGWEKHSKTMQNTVYFRGALPNKTYKKNTEIIYFIGDLMGGKVPQCRKMGILKPKA